MGQPLKSLEIKKKLFFVSTVGKFKKKKKIPQGPVTIVRSGISYILKFPLSSFLQVLRIFSRFQGEKFLFLGSAF